MFEPPKLGRSQSRCATTELLRNAEQAEGIAEQGELGNLCPEFPFWQAETAAESTPHHNIQRLPVVAEKIDFLARSPPQSNERTS